MYQHALCCCYFVVILLLFCCYSVAISWRGLKYYLSLICSFFQFENLTKFKPRLKIRCTLAGHRLARSHSHPSPCAQFHARFAGPSCRIQGDPACDEEREGPVEVREFRERFQSLHRLVEALLDSAIDAFSSIRTSTGRSLATKGFDWRHRAFPVMPGMKKVEVACSDLLAPTAEYSSSSSVSVTLLAATSLRTSEHDVVD